MKQRVVAVAAAVLLAGVSTAVAGSAHPVAPPSAKVGGKTYGEWSAAWWQWALAIPAEPGHPFFDDASFDVTTGQSGNVWFLAGPFGTVERDITIPVGTRLFVAIINAEASNLEAPPFFGDTAEEQLEAAQAFADFIVDPFLEVDGQALANIEDYRFASPQFGFTVPDPNILGVGPGSGTAVSDGYWAMVGPLSKGEHTIHFGGTFEDTPFGSFSLDVTYNVTVE
jgi:hypothetical protein